MRSGGCSAGESPTPASPCASCVAIAAQPHVHTEPDLPAVAATVDPRVVCGLGGVVSGRERRLHVHAQCQQRLHSRLRGSAVQ